MTTAIKPLDIHIIALDETDNWDLEALAAAVGLKDTEEVRHYVKRIEGVYFFNRNEKTHCCEVTPSYCLYWYENRVRFYHSDPKDMLDDWVSQEPGSYDPVYIHCHVIDGLIQKIKTTGNNFRYRHFGNPGLSEEEQGTPEEAMETIRQSFQANAPL